MQNLFGFAANNNFRTFNSQPSLLIPFIKRKREFNDKPTFVPSFKLQKKN